MILTKIAVVRYIGLPLLVVVCLVGYVLLLILVVPVGC